MIILKPNKGEVKFGIFRKTIACIMRCEKCGELEEMVRHIGGPIAVEAMADPVTLQSMQQMIYFELKEKHRLDCGNTGILPYDGFLDKGIENLMRLKEKFGPQALEQGFKDHEKIIKT